MMTKLLRTLLLALCFVSAGAAAIAIADPAYAVGSRWDPNGSPDFDGP